MGCTVRAGAWTTRGCRSHNEDYCLMDPEAQTFVVADGVGGAPYGDVMARICCYASFDLWQSVQEEDPTAALNTLALSLDNQMRKVSQWLGDVGSGAAALFFVIKDSMAACMSVGDCMAYRIRNGLCHKLVKTHRPTEDSHLLTQAFGFDAKLNPYVWCEPIEVGDAFVICTDGIADNLPKNLLVQQLEDKSIEESSLAHRICDKVSGEDNATIIVVSITSTAS